jgi:hypothetical protein
MSKTIKALVQGKEDLTRFWQQYFPETPVCSLPECGSVACEVDSFFPYLDDLNRCENHPLDSADPLRRSARGCTRQEPSSAPGHGSLGSGLTLAMKRRRRLFR